MMHSPNGGILPAPSPPRSTSSHKGTRCGGEGGVRGPYLSLKPPHPGPFPHGGVLSESRADCGGEGADSTDYRQLANAPNG